MTNQQILLECLDTAQDLLDDGRDQEACDYLREWVIPILENWLKRTGR